MAQSSPRLDSSLIKWALLYLFLVLSFVIAAEVVTEGDSSPLITQILGVATPIGAVLIIAIKGGEVAQQGIEKASRIEEKTDVQSEQLAKISHAVNGKMDAKFSALKDEHVALRNKVEGLEKTVVEIRDMLTRALME